MNPYMYFDTLELKQTYLKIAVKKIETHNEITLWDTLIMPVREKEMSLSKPNILLTKVDEHHLKITANTLVLGLFIDVDAKLKFNHNFINIENGIERMISFEGDVSELDLSKFRLYSVYDLQSGSEK